MSKYHHGFSYLLLIIVIAIAGLSYWAWHQQASDQISDSHEWMHITEWGIDVRIPTDTPDLQYAFVDDHSDESSSAIGFSSERLAAAERDDNNNTHLYCSASAAPGGYLVRTEDPTAWRESDAWWSDETFLLGEHYYLFFTSQAPCSDDPATQALQSELKRSLNLQGAMLQENIRMHRE